MHGLSRAMLLTAAAAGVTGVTGAAAQDVALRPIVEAVGVVQESGGDACLEGETFARHVASWLSRETIDARLSVVVTAAPGDVSFVLRRDAEVLAARRFDLLPPDCADRRAAVSLAVALAIDHTILDGLVGRSEPVAEAEPAAEPEPEPPAQPDDGEEAPEPTAEEEAEPGPLRVGAVLAPLLLVEVIPHVTFGASAAFELEWRDRFMLRGSALLTGVVDVDVAPGEAASQLVAGRAEGCIARPVRRLRLHGCAGLAAGVFVARGRGYTMSRETRLPWVALSTRVALRYVLSDVVSFGLAIEGVVLAVRPELRVRGFDGTVLNARSVPPGGGLFGIELVLDLL